MSVCEYRHLFFIVLMKNLDIKLKYEVGDVAYVVDIDRNICKVKIKETSVLTRIRADKMITTIKYNIGRYCDIWVSEIVLFVSADEAKKNIKVIDLTK